MADGFAGRPKWSYEIQGSTIEYDAETQTQIENAYQRRENVTITLNRGWFERNPNDFTQISFDFNNDPPTATQRNAGGYTLKCRRNPPLQSNKYGNPYPALQQNAGDKYGAPQRTNKQDSWTCPICTLQNKLDAPLCTVCGSASPVSRNKTWSCPQCTVVNENSAQICGTCNYNRDKPNAQPNDGPIIEDVNPNRQAKYAPNSIDAKVLEIRQIFPDVRQDAIERILREKNGDKAATVTRIMEIQDNNEAQQKQAQQQQREAEQRRAREAQQQQRERQIQMKADSDDDDDDEMAEAFANLICGAMSAAVVEGMGFEFAKDANKRPHIAHLRRTNPGGRTALRDATALGIIHMLKLKQHLVKIGAFEHKFLHVVLTDGEDTSSELDEDDLQGFYFKVGRELGDVCTTIFVGVNLDASAQRGLQRLSVLGGDSVELHNIRDVEIGEVFDKIQVSLGIIERGLVLQHGDQQVTIAQRQLALQVKERQLLVLFTLDISGSMAGGRWRRTVDAVAAFLDRLSDKDIFGIVLFNDKCNMITGDDD